MSHQFVPQISPEQKANEEVEAVRHALIDGERSGKPQAFDFTEFLRHKVAQHDG